MGHPLKGRVALVTGANSGIGKETALGLSRLGAQVICVCRDKAKGEAALAELKQRSGNEEVSLLLADLSSQASIRAMAEQFKSSHSELHVLVNNAGVINPEPRVTEDGIEETFAVNHLGYFLMTELLLEPLKASAPSRIINVSSDAEKAGRLDFDHLASPDRFGPFRAYAQSKRANLMFTYELAGRLEGTGVSVNAVHPGMVASGFGSSLKGLAGRLIQGALRRFMLSPAQGAQTVIYLASSPEVEGQTGKYWSKKRPVRSSRRSYDQEERKRLWDLSRRLTALPLGRR